MVMIMVLVTNGDDDDGSVVDEDDACGDHDDKDDIASDEDVDDDNYKYDIDGRDNCNGYITML